MSSLFDISLFSRSTRADRYLLGILLDNVARGMAGAVLRPPPTLDAKAMTKRESDQQDMTTSTAHKAARGSVVTLAGQAIKMVLLVLNLILLGRLLTPLDFGLIAMVTAVVGVAELIRDFGITTASIQAPSLSQIQKNNLFWINTCLGLALALAAALLSQPIASFYGDSRLGPITLAISCLFFINGMQAQYQVELTRELRFRTLTLTDIGANSLGLAVAVGSAFMGLGYWSLVAMQLTTAGFLMISRMLVSSWHPGMPGRGGSIRSFLRYGGNLGIAQFINYASANAPNILIGLTSGPVTLGAYSRASQLASLPVNQIFGPLTNVALSTLIRLSDRYQFRRIVGMMQLLLGYVAATGFSLAIVFADNLVKLMLGSQWEAVTPILQILAIGATFQAATFVSYWVFLAKDRTATLLKYNLVTKGIVLGLTILGSIWSVHGMLWGYTAGLVLSWPISLLWMRKLDLPIQDLFLAGIRFIVVGALTAGGGLGLPLVLDLWNSTGMSAMGWSLGLFLALLLPSIRADISGIKRTVMNFKETKIAAAGV